MSTLTYIYALLHPITSELKYVGKTNNLTKRYQAHCRAKGNTYKDKWVRSLHKHGLQPQLLILEECQSTDWIEAEIWWIAYLSSIGCELTNLTKGGETTQGYKHTPTALEKMRQAKLGRSLSIEHRQRVSNSLKGRSKNYRSGKAKTAIVITPTGHTTITLSLRQYSLANNLNPNIMCRIARGLLKSHKGYTVTYA